MDLSKTDKYSENILQNFGNLYVKFNQKNDEKYAYNNLCLKK